MGMIPEASRTKCLTAAVTIFGMTATDLSCTYDTTSKHRMQTIFDDAGHSGIILAPFMLDKVEVDSGKFAPGYVAS